ncbi:glycine-rich domain-containing protein-like [Massilia sp. CF038]|uniref:glycine-rich domain-containing protein n=1 Tax=Massilia sp. CF038 TaxID=1881045 RepID=UPI0009248B91|nr:glycine-rich domain-containing protein-like [Massilia sp. CF038]SHH18274.1 Protein of unknown function [Massilia sp. CF038]
MLNNSTFQAIAALDLEPIKTKLMHVASGEGWSQARADAIETEYRRFLYLMHAFPQEETAPTVDVDTFWHYHILDTMKYATDCDQVFGYFLHHYPYLGVHGESDAGAEQRGGERMRELYEATFGEAYIRAESYGSAAAYCMIRPDQQADAAQAAYCMIRPDQPAAAAQGASAAYCMIRPDDAAGQSANAAYCMIRPDSAAAKGASAAYCMIRPDSVAANAAAAAYCMIRPSTGAAAKAQTAYCMIRPGKKAAKGAEVAYCMLRPGSQSAADAQAAYCMIRQEDAAAAGASDDAAPRAMLVSSAGVQCANQGGHTAMAVAA